MAQKFPATADNPAYVIIEGYISDPERFTVMVSSYIDYGYKVHGDLVLYAEDGSMMQVLVRNDT